MFLRQRSLKMHRMLFKMFMVLLGLFAVTSASDVSVLTAVSHDITMLIDSTDAAPFQINSTEVMSAVVHFTESHSGILAPVSPLKVSSPNLTFNVTITAESAGFTVLRASVINSTVEPETEHIRSEKAFVRVNVIHSHLVNVISSIVGWIYFFAWSISFYPQIYENWKRKSVIGLNFDFLALNVIGFVLYSSFNVGLYWIRPIQKLYFAKNPEGVNPVQLNDVIFSLHAVFACLVTIFQCFIYEKGNQTVSKSCRGILALFFLILFVFSILSGTAVVTWLTFLYVCSYVKLAITLIKYIPQAYMNYRRKSTMGWSIGNILLDFTGGTLSIAQMFLISYNNDDWASIFGDPTKFGLGLISVLFDVFFMLQHYVFYRNIVPHEELIGSDEDGPDPGQENEEGDSQSLQSENNTLE